MDTVNASKYAGLKENTMAMQRSNGTGPKFVKRGRIFYFREDVDAWMNALGRHTSAAQARCAELASVGYGNSIIGHKSECPGGTGQIADQCTNIQISPSAQKKDKSLKQPVRRGEFSALIGGAA